MLHFTFSRFESAPRSIRVRVLCAAFAFFICVFAGLNIQAQTTEFVYQGSLKDGGAPANANYDFEFALFGLLSGGSQIDATIPRNNVPVTNGIFSVKLDFGAQFPGAPRYLEIHVRQTGGGAFTPLTPRQVVTSAPYSVKSLNSDTAINATNATNAVNATNAATATNVSGIVGVANGGTGSETQNFVDLTTDQTIVGNKTFSDTLSGNLVNAVTHYNIGGNRVLSVAGGNTFVGYGAGLSTTGISNSIIGTFAGAANTTGIGNSFFGSEAGFSNVGSDNSFFGNRAGRFHEAGSGNSFFGGSAGNFERNGSNNTLLGYGADLSIGVTLNYATALGAGAIVNADNTVVLGRAADTVQIPGNLNVTQTFTASGAGTFSGGILSLNNSSSNLIGFGPFGVPPPSATSAGWKIKTFGNSYGIGIEDFTQWYVSQANHRWYVIDEEGTSTQLMNLDENGNLSVSGTATATQYNIGGNRILAGPAGDNVFAGRTAGIANTSGSVNSFFGSRSGEANIGGSSNSFFGERSGLTSQGINNSFFGTVAGQSNVGGGNNTIIGTLADVGSPSLSFATALGAGAVVSNSDTIALGRIDGSDKIVIYGLGAAGTDHLCRNASNQISSCSSSARYKSNINPFSSGLSLIRQLRPVFFNWKDGGMLDLGLVAEEVAAVEPLLTTTNAKGEIEGVKYDRLSVVFVNAFKEQQAQIETQTKEISEQKAAVNGLRVEIDLLKAYICSQTPVAAICKPQN